MIPETSDQNASDVEQLRVALRNANAARRAAEAKAEQLEARAAKAADDYERLLTTLKTKRDAAEYEAEEEQRYVWPGRKRNSDAAERAATHLGWIRAIDWVLRKLPAPEASP